MSGSADLPAVLGGPPIRSDGPASWPRSDESIHNIFAELANTGGWGRYEGQYSAELCRLLTEFHNVHETLLCSSGTAAVELALRGLGVQTCAEAILAGCGRKAKCQNILCVGATPVLV